MKLSIGSLFFFVFVQSTTSFDFYYLNSTLCESLDCKLKTQLRNNATQTMSTGVRMYSLNKLALSLV